MWQLLFVKNWRIYRFKELTLRVLMTHVLRKLKETAMLTAIQKHFLKNLIIYMQPRPSPCSLEINRVNLSKIEFVSSLPKLSSVSGTTCPSVRCPRGHLSRCHHSRDHHHLSHL